MAGLNMMVSDWSLIPGEPLVRKWIGVELEVIFTMAYGQLEGKGGD